MEAVIKFANAGKDWDQLLRDTLEAQLAEALGQHSETIIRELVAQCFDEGGSGYKKSAISPLKAALSNAIREQAQIQVLAWVKAHEGDIATAVAEEMDQQGVLSADYIAANIQSALSGLQVTVAPFRKMAAEDLEE